MKVDQVDYLVIGQCTPLQIGKEIGRTERFELSKESGEKDLNTHVTRIGESLGLKIRMLYSDSYVWEVRTLRDGAEKLPSVRAVFKIER